MDSLQEKIWDCLVDLSAGDVIQAFTNYHGTQLLDRGFASFLSGEGYQIDLEEGDDDYDCEGDEGEY